ncbi:MAG: rod-binding protein, partial [Planctomycetota bacterium]
RLPTREAALDAARKFEAMFLRTIIRDMRKSAETFGEGMFGKSVGAGIRESWFDNLMAAHLSKSDQVGLADEIVEDWDRWGLIGKGSRKNEFTEPAPRFASHSSPTIERIRRRSHSYAEDFAIDEGAKMA